MKYVNTQIFTLANPVRFGLKWFVTEEEILAVFTVYEAAARKNSKLARQPLQIHDKHRLKT